MFLVRFGRVIACVFRHVTFVEDWDNFVKEQVR
jgi:hypothetical protein